MVLLTVLLTSVRAGRKPIAIVAASVMLGVSGFVAASAHAEDTLNALIWCDHNDPNLLTPFEEANKVKVNVKEFEGTGAGLAIVAQSKPGDWDVMVIDSIDVRQGVEKKLFEPLPEDKLPFADMFPPVKMDTTTVVDGKRYGITEKYGYNALSYNASKADPKDMAKMSVLWDPKYKGRIAVYDYYLPLIGMMAQGLGKKTADLTEADLPAIKEKLIALKANAKLVGDVASSQTALATGEVDILAGGGEWVTAGLHKDNPALEFTLPDEGGMLWSQSLAIFASSTKKDLALKFVQYVMSPEGQARLATSACYWGMPSNQKAALTADQKKLLRFDDQQAFFKRSQPYPAPSADLDKKMQDMWTEVLQAK